MSDAAPGSAPDVSLIVLAYGAEEWLEQCLVAARADAGPDAELVLVDNGCTRGDLDVLAAATGARVVRPERNLGFAGGCNEGAARAAGRTLVFVNSDAILEPGCVAALVRAVSAPHVGLASACVELADDPGRVNSVGNPVHVSGLTWSGGYGEPIEAHAVSGPVTSATGCALAVRREVWEQLGGFWAELFAYLEDTELSLRCWQHGLEVRYVADARVRHHYEFSRNDLKLHLLERNRLLVLLTVLSRRTLVRLLPVLVLFELLMLALAVKQGWVRAKLAGWRWIVRNRHAIARRHREVRAAVVIGDDQLVPMLVRRLDPANVEPPPGVGLLDAFVRGWCSLVLAASGPPPTVRPHPADLDARRTT